MCIRDRTWAAPSGGTPIVGYQIYLGNTLYGSTTGASIEISGLSSGATYDFTVVAVDSLGRTSSASPSLAVTTSEAPWPYASDPNGFANGDSIPNFEDSQPGNPAAGILTVTILSPVNGSTVQ